MKIDVLKLNLGCGGCTPNGWVNVDYAFGAFLFKIPFVSIINRKLKILRMNWDKSVIIHDLRKKFPWNDNSAGVIYCSHLLEHMSKDAGLFFLKECYRVIQPSGVIRIVVPDLKAFVSAYINGDTRADEFLDKLEVNYEHPADGCIKKKLAPFMRFPHKCMYDTVTLIRVMQKVGFEVSSKRPFDSEIPDINNIELPDRTDNAVIVEGKRVKE